MSVPREPQTDRPEVGSDTELEAERQWLAAERKLLEAERRSIEEGYERMRSLFTQAPMSIAIYQGPEQRIEFANPTFLRVRGRGDDIIGRTYREVFPETGDAGVGVLDAAYRTGEAQLNPEVRAALDRGRGVEEAFFHLSVVPLKNARGQVERVMSVSFEVTDRVLARQAVDTARLKAEAASTAKDDFLAMLGHELRNPLAPIMTALNLMELRGVSGAERELSVISRQVSHLTRLVDDLLDVSRITRGKVELVKEPIEVAEAVARALETASPLFEQRNQYVHVAVARRGLVAELDIARMAQAFANLLTNAAKYTDSGGHISIGAERVGPDILIKFSDDGIGIRAEMLSRIFELFVQEQQALDRARGGLGLGLAIVQSVVTMHGGSITADSAGIGQGSVFTVRLPASSSPPKSLRAQLGVAEAVRSAHPNARRILLVDDNEDAAELLSLSLEAVGHTVRTAYDGPSALLALAEFAPEVALLDIGLPAMDGYELAGRIRAAHAGIRLIALTGYGQESDRERTRAAGFDAHLVKPVDLSVVLATIER